MKYLPSNTLAHYEAAPQVHANDLSGFPVATFAAATKDYRSACGLAVPHDEAMVFYALNHCASLVKKTFTPNEPLPEWAQFVMSNYSTVVSEQGLRMLHYILSITTREMRHLHAMPTSFWDGVEQKFGVEMKDFLELVHSVSNESVAVQRYMDEAPKTTVGKYIEAMAHGFHKGKFSGGYGGHPWGNVADAAAAMIKGTTSMEMLVDTGYTLAHNGGPIFNKGMMYSGYDNSFMTILDVQRSGQIPDLILDTENFKVKKPDLAKLVVLKTSNALPHAFKGHVDWYSVEAAFPAHQNHGDKYSAFKAKQKVAHKVVPVKPAAPVYKVFSGCKVKVVGQWAVAPGQSVEIFERVAS